MTVKELRDAMQLQTLTGNVGLEKDIEGGCVGDLLSYVMAHAREGNVWVTIQGHLNTVAVASLTGVSAIVLTDGIKPDDSTIAKAVEEAIPILSSTQSSFEFCKACSKYL